MELLYNYLLESRGNVTGNNSWSKLVKYIISIYDKIPVEKNFRITRDLSGWIKELYINKKDIYIGLAEYDDSKSKLEEGKMVVYLNINKRVNTERLGSILEHEFQHAFDDWIGRCRKGRDMFIGDDYCVSTGYEGPDYENIYIWDLMLQPKKVTTDHMLYLLNQSTYWFNESEVNAFFREFYLYITKKGDSWDFNDIKTNPNDGAIPLTGIYLIRYTIDHIDDYDLNWEYIMEGLNFRWARVFLNKSFLGNDRGSFIRVLKTILQKKTRTVIKKYSRLLKDQINKGMEIKNLPDWLK